MAHKNKQNLSPYKPKKSPLQRPSAELNSKSFSKPQHRKPQIILSENEINDRLFNVFRNHNFADITHEQRQQLSKFCKMLLEKQRTLNFTRLIDIKDIAIKHFVDCLIVPRLTQLPFPILDMGTGPGFPGIPLKILFPNERILLAEGVQKRVEFLKTVREALALQNLDVIGRNINEDFRLPVQGVITRAVEDSRNTLRNVRTCLQVGGLVLQMKGPRVDPEIELAMKEMHHWYDFVQSIPYELPHTPHQRRLVIFRKTKAYDPDFDEPTEPSL